MRVFATARKTEAIQDLADLGIETLSLEVNDEQSINACRDDVKRAVGSLGLNYLVNNAGRSKSSVCSTLVFLSLRIQFMFEYIDYAIPALDAEFSEIEAVFATNLFAIMRICQIFMPLLIQGHGTIIQIGSVAGCFPYAWGSIYNASKAALHSYSSTLRVEVAPFGVHVITVVTAGVKSRIARVKRSLRDESLYKSLQENYERRQVHSQDMGMDAGAYAKDVVGQILGAEGWLWRTRTIWAGGGAGLVRWLSWLLPESTMSVMVSKMFGFEKLREIEKKKDV